jgi:ribosomal protein L11 methyltransferase
MTALSEVEVEIPPSAVAAVEEVLLELGEPGWSLREDAVAGRAWIIGIFPDDPTARIRWSELSPLLPAAAAGPPAWRRIEEREWRESYRAHFRSWTFGRLHWVPVWEREGFRAPPGDAVLWLDPGMAFGTGNHETTRLCVERLASLAQGRSVIDAGCGSGILALSAALLGAGPVLGFDLDPEAVRVSRENAALNGLSDRVEFAEADLRTGLEGRTAGLVLANIQADVLVGNARDLLGAVAPEGALILSGILAREGAEVRAAFAAAAPDWPAESRLLGEWCDLLLTRPGLP